MNPFLQSKRFFLKKNISFEPIFIKKEESPEDFCRSVRKPRKPRKPYIADDGSIVVVFFKLFGNLDSGNGGFGNDDKIETVEIL